MLQNEKSKDLRFQNMLNDETIASLFDADLQVGMNRVEKMKWYIISSVQDIKYGKAINENIKRNKIPKSYREALLEAKKHILLEIMGSVDSNGKEYDGHFDSLKENEKELFKINGEFNVNNITNSFLEGIRDTALVSSEQVVEMYDMLVTYANYEDLAIKAMPFLKDKSNQIGDDSLDDRNLESFNTVKDIFDPSQTPALETFSEFVRFFFGQLQDG